MKVLQEKERPRMRAKVDKDRRYEELLSIV